MCIRDSLYSLATNAIVEGSGSCKKIAPSPKSDQLTVWCEIEYHNQKHYYSLEDRGVILQENSPPKASESIIEWAFAPDNRRLVFAPQDGKTVISNGKEETEIDIYVETLPEFRTGSYLQWSENGERLLIYGKNDSLCPKWKDPVLGTFITKECWIVIDANTGKILWHPDQSISEAIGAPLEELNVTCASLSPDSRWLALCVRQGSIFSLILISIEENTIRYYGSSHVLSLAWK